MQAQVGQHPPYQIWQGRQGNYTRFINHSCQPNCQFHTFTWLGVERIIVVSKGVAAGGELTVDYSGKYWRHLDKKCLCGETRCRQHIQIESVCRIMRILKDRMLHIGQEGIDHHAIRPCNLILTAASYISKMNDLYHRLFILHLNFCRYTPPLPEDLPTADIHRRLRKARGERCARHKDCSRRQN